MTRRRDPTDLDDLLHDARRVQGAQLDDAGASTDAADLLDRLGFESADVPGMNAELDPRWGGDLDLDAALDDARRLVEAHLETHRRAPPAMAASTGGPTRHRFAVGVLVAAAAAIVVFSVSTLLATRPSPSATLLMRHVDLDRARAQLERPSQPSEGSLPSGELPFIRPAAAEMDLGPPPAPGAVPGLESGPAPELSGQRLGVAADGQHGALEIERVSSEASLAALDAEATRAWKAGETRRARALFWRIVDHGGRSIWAEQAFGELMAIERKLDLDAATRNRTRKHYLARFPRGRYADSVRAEICRTVAEARRGRCWRDYVARHPDGAHRAEADASLAP